MHAIRRGDGGPGGSPERARPWAQLLFLAYLVLVLAVAIIGFAIHYEQPTLIGSPQMLELLDRLGVPVALATTVSFVLPFTAATLLAFAVLLGRRDDLMALLFAGGLVGLFLFWSGAPRAVAAALPALSAVAAAVESLAIGLVVLMVYVFPDGRFRPRWTFPLAGLLVALLVLVPGLPATARLLAVDPDALTPWKIVLTVVVVGVWVFTGAIAQALRYRRYADAVQRQQQRWILFGLAVLLVPSVAVLIAAGLGAVRQTAWLLLAMALLSCVLPTTATVALFRYRLFELDRLVSRTISWTAMTILLGVAYLGLVVALQAVLAPLTGGSDLAVAISTLLVAALFSPTRQGIQRWVDRRFYRSRYDAKRVVERFTQSVRHGVALEALADDLTEVVKRTLQPASVSIWLRGHSQGTTSSGR